MARAQATSYDDDAPFFSSQISYGTLPALFSPAEEDGDEAANSARDSEFEVEEEEYVIPYTMRKYITTEECAEWTQLIHIRAMHKGKEIGRADGRYIDRDQIREYFYEAMDEPSGDTLELATELFDSRGRLKSELRAGEGSGIWGNEMNTGGFLFLQTIEVGKEWQKRGIGRDLVEAFMQKGQNWKPDVQFVFAKPGQLNAADTRYEQESMTRREVIAAIVVARKTATAFWRAIGYRRIAASDWFATAFDPLHPVHQLAIEDDYDIKDDAVLDRGQERERDFDERLGLVNGALAQHEAMLKSLYQNSVGGEDDPSDSEEEEVDEDEVGDERPIPAEREELRLRVALVTLPDDQCLELWKMPARSQALLEEDTNGNNILHIAAMACKPQSLSFIFGDVLTANMKARFISAANNHGETPLTILTEEIARGRDFESGPFHEKGRAAQECLGIWRKQQQNAGICTCGECLEGFLSPRMKFALKLKGDLIYDMMQEGIDGSIEWPDTWLTLADANIREHLGRDIELRHAFANVFRNVAICLEKGIVPYASNLVSEGKFSQQFPTSYFSDAGGKVERVLGQCLGYARDEEGDGSHYDTFQEEIDQLPECLYDGHFGLVAALCGIRQGDLNKYD